MCYRGYFHQIDTTFMVLLVKYKTGKFNPCLKMLKFKTYILISCILLFGVFFVDCKKKPTDKISEEPEATFDKSGMLINYADNLIIPNIQIFKNSIDTLVITFENFTHAKTISNLNTLRGAYVTALLKFQHVSTFEFGPAESEIIRSNFNTYPTNTVQINANITTNTYHLGTLNNLNAKGFPAIDYLLYGERTSADSILKLFNSDAKALNRINYLKACLSELQLKTNTVLNAWKTEYRATFIASTGLQIGSSMGMLVNQLNFEIDLLKNSKIGIPLGKKSLGKVLPQNCEAYFADTISVKLAKQCLINIESVYFGRSSYGMEGKGIDDYLEYLDAKHGEGKLSDAIKNQFAIAKSKLALIKEPLSESVFNDAPTIDIAYIELVKLLVLLKTDAPSAMGVVITYQDGDGD